MKSTKIKLLLVVGRHEEALRIVSEFEGGGYKVLYKEVRGREELETALGEEQWDIVIAADTPHNLPLTEVVDVCKRLDPGLPLIVITCRPFDEIAVKISRTGVRDVVCKENMRRLLPAVIRELERDRAEERLSESEERYRKLKEFYKGILDNAPVSIMVIGTDERITAVNRYFSNFTGSDDVIGRRISDIEFFKRERLVDDYRAIFETGRSFSRTDCETVNKQGEKKFLNIIAVPFRDADGSIKGAISMATDNTETHFSREKLLEMNRALEKEVAERRVAEERVRVLSKINQKILDNVPVSIVMLDNAGRIVGANKKATELMDKPERSIIGQRLVDTKDIVTNDCLKKMYEDLLDTGHRFYYDDLHYIEEATGDPKHLNILAVPLKDEQGYIEGAISIATDNTEAVEAKNTLKRMSEELERKVKEQTAELERINRELTTILDLKSRFVADASHELRTPLTVIRGNIDLAIMEAEGAKKEVPELYQLILEEVERMRLVLGDLTMIPDVNAGRDHIERGRVDIAEVVRSVERSLRIIATQKEICLECEEASDDLSLIGDAAKLEKLISNIVRNAIKYTDPGGLVRITARKEKDGVIVAVTDSGIGIPKEDLPRIFERFYRVDRARTRNESGSGLGLSIAQWVVEAHGGSIDVTSTEGEGSTFTIRLPFRPPSPAR